MNITQLSLYTENIKSSKDFYTNTLQLALKEECKTSFTVKVGHTDLTFIESGKETKPFYHYAINISSDKIQTAHDWLKSRVRILQYEGEDIYYYPDWNASSLYFMDPAGNIVELIARHNLPDLSVGDSFTNGDFTGVSEIGMPVFDVLADAEYLASELGITAWRIPYPTFTALGDENGLIILVSKGRQWFMTDKEAEIHPFAVAFKGGTIKTISIHEYNISVNS